MWSKQKTYIHITCSTILHETYEIHHHPTIIHHKVSIGIEFSAADIATLDCL